MNPTLTSYDNDESKSQGEFNRLVTNKNQEKDYITLISGVLDSTERNQENQYHDKESTLNHNDVSGILHEASDGHFEAQPRTEFRTYFSTNRNKGKPDKGENVKPV